jgi:predicted membrane protein
MNLVAIMSGISRGNNSSAFRGADLVAIMGGCELDLRKAAINGEATIDLFCMWGGIEIRVPEDWTVESHVVPLMGGVEDKTRPIQAATTHRLTLRGVALMGGVEIRN